MMMMAIPDSPVVVETPAAVVEETDMMLTDSPVENPTVDEDVSYTDVPKIPLEQSATATATSDEQPPAANTLSVGGGREVGCGE